MSPAATPSEYREFLRLVGKQLIFQEKQRDRKLYQSLYEKIQESKQKREQSHAPHHSSSALLSPNFDARAASKYVNHFFSSNGSTRPST